MSDNTPKHPKDKVHVAFDTSGEKAARELATKLEIANHRINRWVKEWTAKAAATAPAPKGKAKAEPKKAEPKTEAKKPAPKKTPAPKAEPKKEATPGTGSGTTGADRKRTSTGKKVNAAAPAKRSTKTGAGAPAHA
jgi:hypothetical protein